MNQNNIHKTLNQLRLITKYGMSILCLILTAHCGLLYMGHDVFAVHVIFVSFLLLIALKLSQIFNLCWVHKTTIVYCLSVIMCVVMRRHDIFAILGIDLHTARGVMYIVGIIMCCLNIWKARNNENC